MWISSVSQLVCLCCNFKISFHLFVNRNKVQQRGVQGSESILKQCLSAVRVPEGASVNVYDLIPNRFAEWSRAIWGMQLKALQEPNQNHIPFTYTGFFIDDVEQSNQQSALHGRVMSDWGLQNQIGLWAIVWDFWETLKVINTS